VEILTAILIFSFYLVAHLPRSPDMRHLFSSSDSLHNHEICSAPHLALLIFRLPLYSAFFAFLLPLAALAQAGLSCGNRFLSTDCVRSGDSVWVQHRQAWVDLVVSLHVSHVYAHAAAYLCGRNASSPIALCWIEVTCASCFIKFATYSSEYSFAPATIFGVCFSDSG